MKNKKSNIKIKIIKKNSHKTITDKNITYNINNSKSITYDFDTLYKQLSKFIYWIIPFNDLWIVDGFYRINKNKWLVKKVLKNWFLFSELNEADYLRLKILYWYIEDLKCPSLSQINLEVKNMNRKWNKWVNPNYNPNTHVIYNRNW